MEIQLHNTTKIVFLNGIPARVWKGVTASGIPVFAFITRIGVDKNKDLSEFDAELSEESPPSAELQVFPLRLLI